MNPMLGQFLQAHEIHRWLSFLSQWKRDPSAPAEVPSVLRILALNQDDLDLRLHPIALLSHGAELRGIDGSRGRDAVAGFTVQTRRWALQALERLPVLSPQLLQDCTSVQGRRQLLAAYLISKVQSDSLRALVVARVPGLPAAHAPTDSPIRGQLPDWLWDSLLLGGLPHELARPVAVPGIPQNAARVGNKGIQRMDHEQELSVEESLRTASRLNDSLAFSDRMMA